MYAAPGARPAVEEIALDAPGPHEVQVRVEASGLCHTDLHVVETGGWGMPFPILLGHEGAGVVEELGAEVTTVAAGDRVVIAWRAPCGACPSCLPRRPASLLVAACGRSGGRGAPSTAPCSRPSFAAAPSPTGRSCTRPVR